MLYDFSINDFYAFALAALGMVIGYLKHKHDSKTKK